MNFFKKNIILASAFFASSLPLGNLSYSAADGNSGNSSNPVINIYNGGSYSPTAESNISNKSTSADFSLKENESSKSKKSVNDFSIALGVGVSGNRQHQNLGDIHHDESFFLSNTGDLDYTDFSYFTSLDFNYKYFTLSLWSAYIPNGGPSSQTTLEYDKGAMFAFDLLLALPVQLSNSLEAVFRIGPSALSLIGYNSPHSVSYFGQTDYFNDGFTITDGYQGSSVDANFTIAGTASLDLVVKLTDNVAIGPYAKVVVFNPALFGGKNGSSYDAIDQIDLFVSGGLKLYIY